LRQIGIVAAADGTRLQRILRPGQRLVSTEGQLALGRFRRHSRGVGCRRHAPGRAQPARRARREEAEVRRAAEAARAAAETAAERLGSAQAEEAAAPAWREAQTRWRRPATSSPPWSVRHADGSQDAAVTDAEATTRKRWSKGTAAWRRPRRRCRRWAARKLSRPIWRPRRRPLSICARASPSRTELITPSEHRARTERQAAIRLERERWQTRSAGADQQIATLKERDAEAEAEIAKLAALPP
jgi:chromosome segregation protein